MNTKHLKTRILDLALQGKLVENSRIPNDVKSRIPSDFNPPFEIPNSWAWVKLGDICDFQNGFAFKSKDFKNSGYFVIKIANIQNNEITKENAVFCEPEICENLENFSVKRGDILIAMSGATTGKIGIYNLDEKAFLNQRVGLFKNFSKNIDKRFFYFVLLTKVEESLKIAIGSAQPNLSTEQIKSFYIPLPPLDEQERIVKKIDELFSQIDILDKHKESLLKNIKHTKARILDLALQGKLVENSRIPNDVKSRIPSDFNPPFEIPNSWAWVKLGDICDFQNGFAFKSKDFKNSGYFVIKIANIQNNEITKENAVFCEPEICENLENFSVKRGDILIAMSGATTGKIGIYNLDEKAFLNQRVGLFKNFSKNIDKRFFYFVLLTKVEESLKIAIGSAQPNLSTEQIKSFYIPLPPLDEQERIVKKIDELFEILEVIENSL